MRAGDPLASHYLISDEELVTNDNDDSVMCTGNSALEQQYLKNRNHVNSLEGSTDPLAFLSIPLEVPAEDPLAITYLIGDEVASDSDDSVLYVGSSISEQSYLSHESHVNSIKQERIKLKKRRKKKRRTNNVHEITFGSQTLVKNNVDKKTLFDISDEFISNRARSKRLRTQDNVTIANGGKGVSPVAESKLKDVPASVPNSQLKPAADNETLSFSPSNLNEGEIVDSDDDCLILTNEEETRWSDDSLKISEVEKSLNDLTEEETSHTETLQYISRRHKRDLTKTHKESKNLKNMRCLEQDSDSTSSSGFVKETSNVRLIIKDSDNSNVDINVNVTDILATAWKIQMEELKQKYGRMKRCGCVSAYKLFMGNGTIINKKQKRIGNRQPCCSFRQLLAIYL